MKRWIIGTAGRTSSHVRALVQAGALVMAMPSAESGGAEVDPSASPDESKYSLPNPTPPLRLSQSDRPMGQDRGMELRRKLDRTSKRTPKETRHRSPRFSPPHREREKSRSPVELGWETFDNDCRLPVRPLRHR